MKKFRNVLAFCLATALMFSTVSAAVAGTNVTNIASKKNFTELEYTVFANTVTISGVVGAAKKTAVSFYATDGVTNIATRIVYSDATGSFEHTLRLNPARYNADNSCSITIGAPEHNARIITGIELYSEAELQACTTAFKGISSVDDMRQFFVTYAAMLNMSGVVFTDADLEVMYNGYTDNPPAANIGLTEVVESIEYITRYKFFFMDLTEAAQNGDGAEIKTILCDRYADMVPFETAVPLIHNEAEMYARMTGPSVTYSSFDQLEQAFEAAKAAQKEAEAFDGEITSDREYSFEDCWKISVNGNLITISGSTGISGVREIAFYVTDYNVTSPHLLAVYQAPTDENGDFSVSFAVDPSLYGGETQGIVRVSGRDFNIWQFMIKLYPEDTLNAMTAALNGISTQADMESFFANYSAVTGIGGGYSSAKIKLMHELYGEVEHPAVTIPEVAVKRLVEFEPRLNKVNSFITAMNNYSSSKLWAKMENAVEQEFEELAEESSTYKELYDRSVENDKSSKSVYLGMIDKSFACIGDIIDAFDVAYEAAPVPESGSPGDSGNLGDSGSQDGFGGTGGGTGGGGGGAGNRVEIDVDFDENIEQKVELEESKKPTSEFGDLEGFDWAKDAINGLRGIGIVQGDGNGKYRPADKVTREEFLSMLLKTYYIEQIKGTTSFSDVDKNQWYYDTVCTASALGITNGMGDGRFGIGENIIRADMVVLASRLSDRSGIYIREELAGKVFSDYASIPEYAYNDVVRFQQAGVIQGNETGAFNPKGELTRAEAAVFFWNIFKLIENQI